MFQDFLHINMFSGNLSRESTLVRTNLYLNEIILKQKKSRKREETTGQNVLLFLYKLTSRAMRMYVTRRKMQFSRGKS